MRDGGRRQSAQCTDVPSKPKGVTTKTKGVRKGPFSLFVSLLWRDRLDKPDKEGRTGIERMAVTVQRVQFALQDRQPTRWE